MTNTKNRMADPNGVTRCVEYIKKIQKGVGPKPGPAKHPLSNHTNIIVNVENAPGATWKCYVLQVAENLRIVRAYIDVRSRQTRTLRLYYPQSGINTRQPYSVILNNASRSAPHRSAAC